MGLGLEVGKGTLDNKAAEAVLKLREALDKAETIASWLGNHPVVNAVDPLTSEEFGYNADEAYALRYFFESVAAIRAANESVMAAGRKMTGLE